MAKVNIVIDLTVDDQPMVICEGFALPGVEAFGWHDDPVWQVARAVRDYGDDFADTVPIVQVQEMQVMPAEPAEGEAEWEEETLGSEDTQDPEPEPEEHKCDHPGYYGYCPDGGFVEPATLQDYREMRAAQWRASRELGPPLNTSGKRVLPPRKRVLPERSCKRKHPLPK